MSFKHKSSVRITVRDMLIAEKVFTTGYMTTPQIWRLFFRHTKPYLVCNQRLKKLVDYGVLRVIEQSVKRGEGRKPYIYALGPVGGELLVQERGVDPKLVYTKPWANEENNLKLKHTLATTDCILALYEACATSEYTVEAWETEREIRSQRTKETKQVTGSDGKEYKTPVPDLQVTLRYAEKFGVFLWELDRCTEDIALSSFERQSITGKVIEYLVWEQSEHYGSLYGTRPVRVQFVTTGVRRLRNMKTAAETVVKRIVQLPDTVPDEEVQKQAYKQKLAAYRALGARFRFTTLEQVVSKNVLAEPIWQVAGYKEPKTLGE